jgi:PAS domain S-box-containing protein
VVELEEDSISPHHNENAGAASERVSPWTIDFQRIFESAPALFLVLGTDENFTILDASNAMLRATYTEREAIVGRPVSEVFPDNPEEPGATGKANLHASLKRVLAERRPDTQAVQKHDIRRPKSSGVGFEERYWSPVNAPVFGDNGQMLYIVHRVEDVTEFVTANQALAREGETMRLEVLLRSKELAETNQQLREVTEQFKAMYEQGLFAGRLRLDGTVIDVNNACVDVCGFDRADIIDRPFWDCGWWNRSPQVQAWVRNAVMQAVSGTPFRGESRYFWADGSEHIVDFACMPIKDNAGRVVIVVPTGMDITERLHAEENRRVLEAERRRSETLAEIDQAKTAFFSNVSHEFRTPLTLILGSLEDLLTRAAATDLAPLEMIHGNALRLLKMVNTLLEFSRVQAGRLQAIYEPTDLPSLTRDLASNFISTCGKAGLTLTVDVEPLPEPVFVDPQMWEKIVLNLVSNAFKFTLAGEINVSVGAEGTNAVLRVRDTGTGIPEPELPRIFERFHRVEGARGRTFEGTGIGLALVNELVRLHHGSIDVESTVGRGTCFTIRIPLGVAHLPEAQVGAARGQATTGTGIQTFVREALSWLPSDARDATEEIRAAARSSRERILLADDNADVRDYVRRLLEGRYDVEAVPDGEAALEAIERAQPDLLLTDVMMPRLDGIQLLAKLRADPLTNTIPVILLSARAGEESCIEGMQAGADDYLIKPFTARNLFARVEAHVKMTRARRAAERALRENEKRLADELAVATRMHQVSTRLVQAGDISSLLEEMLDAAIDISKADMGNIQLLEHGAVKIAAQRGFDFFDAGYDGLGACGAALQRGERIIVDDAASSEFFVGTPALPVMARANALAVQATPLVSRSGETLGVVSTYYKTRRRPTDHELRLLDTLARQAADLLERKRADQIQQFLINELNHRVKNTLANVQAIAQQTLRRTKNPAEFASSFFGRVQSLSRAHSLLSATAWQGADLRDLIRDQILLWAVDPTRLAASGPAVVLEPQMALHVALMLHEMGTNASKYGALSVPAGRVVIRWTVKNRFLHLHWEECGGPAVRAPTSRGFGTTLIEQSSKGEGGDACMSVTRDGIAWEITMVLSHPLVAEPNHTLATELPIGASAGQALQASHKPMARLAGKRFLVVEDEPLVALEIAGVLEGAGAAVACTGTADEALRLTEANAPDAALLDGNLHRRPVDEIAAALTHRNIPFLFVTGYGTDSLPTSFRNVTVLTKPVSEPELLEAAARLTQYPRPPGLDARARGIRPRHEHEQVPNRRNNES